MPESDDSPRTIQMDKDRLRPRILAGDLGVVLEMSRPVSRIVISTRAGSNPLQTT